jgi:hypothetical protein
VTRLNLDGPSTPFVDVWIDQLHGIFLKLALFRVTQPFCTNVPGISPDLALSPDLQICISRSIDLYCYNCEQPESGVLQQLGLGQLWAVCPRDMCCCPRRVSVSIPACPTQGASLVLIGPGFPHCPCMVQVNLRLVVVLMFICLLKLLEQAKLS